MPNIYDTHLNNFQWLVKLIPVIIFRSGQMIFPHFGIHRTIAKKAPSRRPWKTERWGGHRIRAGPWSIEARLAWEDENNHHRAWRLGVDWIWRFEKLMGGGRACRERGLTHFIVHTAQFHSRGVFEPRDYGRRERRNTLYSSYWLVPFSGCLWITGASYHIGYRYLEANIRRTKYSLLRASPTVC